MWRVLFAALIHPYIHMYICVCVCIFLAYFLSFSEHLFVAAEQKKKYTKTSLHSYGNHLTAATATSTTLTRLDGVSLAGPVSALSMLLSAATAAAAATLTPNVRTTKCLAYHNYLGRTDCLTFAMVVVVVVDVACIAEILSI